MREKMPRQPRQVTPNRLIEEATPETSALHDRFEWDNAKAAHQWRLKQAQEFLSSLIIEEQDTAPQSKRESQKRKSQKREKQTKKKGKREREK